jgi:hypothetical protein
MKKLKFKTDHLKKMNFNTKDIRKQFDKLRKENEEILKSSKVDSDRLKITFDI